MNYYGQSICTPARSSILTGRYASHTGLQHSYWMQGEAGGLPLKFKTIADHFAEAGYARHMVGKVCNALTIFSLPTCLPDVALFPSQWHLGFESWSRTPIERGRAS